MLSVVQDQKPSWMCPYFRLEGVASDDPFSAGESSTSSHLTAVTALRALDDEFESVSSSLKVPFYRTFFRVTVPVCLPAVLDIGRYLFVNAMVTISAVVFLYAPDTQLASVAILNMDEAGEIGAAAAMAF